MDSVSGVNFKIYTFFCRKYVLCRIKLFFDLEILIICWEKSHCFFIEGLQYFKVLFQDSKQAHRILASTDEFFRTIYFLNKVKWESEFKKMSWEKKHRPPPSPILLQIIVTKWKMKMKMKIIHCIPSQTWISKSIIIRFEYMQAYKWHSLQATIVHNT